MAKLELNPGEITLKKGCLNALQGGKVKFLVKMDYTLTNQRFVYHDLGGWAMLYSQVGALWQLLIKGKRKELLLSQMRIGRGKYGMNKDLMALASTDGQEVLAGGFEYVLKMLQEGLAGAPQLRLAQSGEEEWMVLGA